MLTKFMAGLKEEIFEKSHFQPYVWLQYLDDIFLYMDRRT